MSHYGAASLAKLTAADPALQQVFTRVDETRPHTILETIRDLAQQEANVANGVSQTLDSRHLDRPARAVDAAPDPFDGWPKLEQGLKAIDQYLEAAGRDGLDQVERKHLLALVRKAAADYALDLAQWYYFGGYVSGTAQQMYRTGEISHPVRWGGDWNGNGRVDDQHFNDLPHFELPPLGGV